MERDETLKWYSFDLDFAQLQPSTGEAAFILGIAAHTQISERQYDSLPEWAKSYWLLAHDPRSLTDVTPKE